MPKWVTTAAKFWVAVVGGAGELVALWADAPSWIHPMIGFVTAAAVWLVKNAETAKEA